MRNLPERIAHAAFACIVLAAALAATAAEYSPQDEIDAVWKAQSILFQYRSEGRRYRCDILEYKIRTILYRLGARDRLALRPSRCRDLAAHARFEVLMESPVAATAHNVRTITRYDSKDELVARVRGVQLPSSTDLQRFPAVWQSVSFKNIDLDAGDCALVQQLRRQVLPAMSVQVLKDMKGIDCSQQLAGIGRPRLTVLALVRTTGSQSLAP